MSSAVILPEEQQHCLRECLEVVVPVDLRVVPQRYFTKHLRRGDGNFSICSQIKIASLPSLRGEKNKQEKVYHWTDRAGRKGLDILSGRVKEQEQE